MTRHYDAAIAHMRRAIDDAGPQAPFEWMRSLIDIHHPVLGALRGNEYERLVREGVTRYPAEPHAHSYLIAMLADTDQPIDAAAAAARAAIPKTADARADLAGSLAAHARQLGPLMPEAGLQAILTEAMSLVNEALKMNPKHAHALSTKTRIEQLKK